MKRAKKGEDCSMKNCQGPLSCSFKDEKCVEKNMLGGEGDECRDDFDCDPRMFYCKSDLSGSSGGGPPRRFCAKKLRVGSKCGMSIDNFECLNGFCLVKSSFGAVLGQGGICQRTRRIGELCRFDGQCGGPNIVCNGARNIGDVRGGKCFNQTMLLKRPGLACNRKMDKCDSRRSLRCAKYQPRKRTPRKRVPRRKRAKKSKRIFRARRPRRVRMAKVEFRCLQRSSFGDLCSRRSKFSKCLTESIGAPLECRRRLGRTTKKPYKSDVCSRARETIRQGQICTESEYAVCEKGTECRLARGVSNVGGRYLPIPLGYCMKVVPKGSTNCSDDSFDTICEDGSYCVRGKCQPGSVAPRVPKTFAAVSGNCSSIPCAPGLVCVEQRGSKQCTLPTMTVNLGEACYETALHFKVCSFILNDRAASFITGHETTLTQNISAFISLLLEMRKRFSMCASIQARETYHQALPAVSP